MLVKVEFRLILVFVPLQMLTAEAFVTAGAGFTVTVIVYAGPVQPVAEVGVIIY